MMGGDGGLNKAEQRTDGWRVLGRGRDREEVEEVVPFSAMKEMKKK